MRAVLQFHKFARFAPGQPRATDAQYRALLLELFRIPVWMPERRPAKRIVIPGYRDLNEFSRRARARRSRRPSATGSRPICDVGNWRMVGPFPRFGQANACAQIERGLDRGKLEECLSDPFPEDESLRDPVRLPCARWRKPDAFRRVRSELPNTLSWVEYDAKAARFQLRAPLVLARRTGQPDARLYITDSMSRQQPPAHHLDRRRFPEPDLECQRPLVQ